MSSLSLSGPLVSQASAHLQQAGTPHGFLASLQAVDNYQRIWSRDGVIAGITALFYGLPEAETGLHHTLRSLALGQGRSGQIPSNVQVGEDGLVQAVSYGGLAGRTDSTAWFVAGAALLGIHRDPHGFRSEMVPAVHQAIAVMEAWEFNQRHLMYVPVSGNWADEYPVQGYLLYDQLVRLWGLEMAAHYWNRPDWAEKATHIRQTIELNYWMDDENVVDGLRHPVALQAAAPIAYAACGFSPSGYDTRFDLAANALMLMLGVGTTARRQRCLHWLADTARQRGHWLFPAFSPVIFPQDPEWKSLSLNHSYRFKNHPYHFHNGGIWPVWLGWLAIGLACAGASGSVAALAADLAAHLRPDDDLPEYLAGDSLAPGGTHPLSYTASGILLADGALTQSPASLKHFFTPHLP